MTLKFRAGEAPAKDVLQALEAVKKVLEDLGPVGLLDPKLSEYALFPLAQQVFNETRRLSPRCLEVATQCVKLLVKYGYRQSLLPELGKQLLILMSMLAGAGPARENDQTTDELKVAAFECILAVVEALRASAGGLSVLENQGTKNVVDQLVYLLLDAITNAVSDHVQLEASNVLTSLLLAIDNRVFLASLLPRTVSALTKALKPSTKARRTQKVLAANLKALRHIISRTLSDRLALNPAIAEEKDILSKSWLNATVGQVKNAVLQVVKLRTQESASVRKELEQLCVMVIEECHTTLVDSVSAMMETLVVLSAQEDGKRARLTIEHLLTVYPDMVETLRASFENLYQALPRLMQNHDEQTKCRAIQKLTATLELLTSQELDLEFGDSEFLPVLINSVSNAIQVTPNKPIEIDDAPDQTNAMKMSILHKKIHFQHFVLNHESQKNTSQELQSLFSTLSQLSAQSKIVRHVIDIVADSDGVTRLAAFWVALKLLDDSKSNMLDAQEWFVATSPEDQLLSRSSLIADLHANSLPLLANVFDEEPDNQYRWQMQALAMECVVMYAQTFPGDSYRPELMDTLYPVLSFLGSPNAILRSHAINALNSLAQTCQYPSTKDLLIDNVDYLVNSVAWKLNTYSLSPEAPQILQMMVKLCGAQLIPYLDDLIQSIFAALDSYHGYSQWVEALFSTLKTMVDEGKRQPQLAIIEGRVLIDHKSKVFQPSTKDDILNDLRLRKRRKLDFDRTADEPPTKAPQRPWTNELDGPTFPRPLESQETDTAAEDDNDDSETSNHLAPMKPSEEEERKLSKTHELLLSIARSTLPHLSSPSPQVRHLLLDLLKDISPLLSRDEASFLPLINAIWPVLVPRLFSEQDTSSDSMTEAAYNICAAAETVAVLCEGAGDFMSSRIEDISAQLLRLVRDTQTRVHANRNPTGQGQGQGQGHGIKGAVSLDIVRPSSSSPFNGDNTNGVLVVPTTTTTKSTHLVVTTRELRTSQKQILNALLRLLVVVLGHVRLTLDTADQVVGVLLQYLDDRSLGLEVRKVLEEYNADAVWLFEMQRKMHVPVGAGSASSRTIVEMQEDVGTGMPQLRQELRDMRVTLIALPR